MAVPHHHPRRYPCDSQRPFILRDTVPGGFPLPITPDIIVNIAALTARIEEQLKPST